LAKLARFALPAALALAGCSPHIGDHCNLNTDCSIQGTLFCDTSQPNGYCTFFNCVPNGCQQNAICVMLRPAVPGCPYDDYNSPSRTGRTMCLAPCTTDSDCRSGEGYVCRDPRQPPWNGIVMDNSVGNLVCVVDPDYDGGVPASFADAEPPICQAGPDAGVPPLEAGVHLEDGALGSPEAGPDAEAGADAGAGADADAGADAGADAPAGD
jgi:hypothetical protein